MQKNKKNREKTKSLYIHIPFCKKKCNFCSFPVSVGSAHHTDAYLKALSCEAARYDGPFVNTLYIGGGTPNCLDERQLETLLEMVREKFRFSKMSEFTIEGNPELFTLSKMKLLKENGINRISLGVQSLNDKYLKFLGRLHTAQNVRTVFSNLRKEKFDNISLDLMFSFPGQTTKELKDDIDGITAFDSEHISLYALTIEEGSRFYIRDVPLDDGYLRGEHYSYITKSLKKKGFKQYEISNFAKPHKESQHNKIYWQGGNYIGLGMGAHSHADGKRSWNIARLHPYMKQIQESGNATEGEEILNPAQRLHETLVFGLRMNEGVDLKKLENGFRCQVSSQTKGDINALVEEGFLILKGNRLRVTARGRIILDELSACLI